MKLNLAQRAQAVRLVVFDLDGVFTDGRFWLTADGEEIKSFHARDGVGVKQLLHAGLEVAVISGRNARAVDHRMGELGVKHVFQGISDKRATLDALRAQLGLGKNTHAAMGDDLPDLALFEGAAVTAAVADAHRALRSRADIVTSLGGGRGAVREFAEHLLALRGASVDDDVGAG